MMDTTRIQVLPWYRQFWPWFLFGLPASVVVAGIITVLIAVEKADTLVDDDYYRSGLGINQNLQGQRYAQTLGLEARFTFNMQRGVVELILLGDFSVSQPGQHAQYPDQLLLEFSHPVRSEKDYSLQLLAVGGNRFQSSVASDVEQSVALLIPGRWYLRLSDPNASRHWLLQSPQSFALPTPESSGGALHQRVNYTIHAGSRSAHE